MPDLASPYSATQSATLLPPTNKWWLKDPLAPALNTTLRVESFSLTPREEVGVFDGLGRDDAAFSSDGRKGWTLNMGVRTESEAEFLKLDAILETGRVLLLQDGVFPRQWYSKLVSSGDWEQIIASDPSGAYPVRYLYRMSLTFQTSLAP